MVFQINFIINDTRFSNLKYRYCMRNAIKFIKEYLYCTFNYYIKRDQRKIRVIKIKEILL